VSIHPGGRLVATANNGRVALRTVERRGGLTDTIECVAADRVRFSPDGTWLAGVGISVDGVKLWPVDGDAVVEPPKQLYVHDDPYLDSATKVVFSADGRRLVAASCTDVIVWEWAEGAPVPRACISFDAPVVTVAISPDSTMLATAADLRPILLWDLS
uniref:WD40 repeat domain-containing protein n=1 Tax=Frankia sp. Cr1 TaxID=3073931 RepID=UPI002AD28E70